MAKVKTKLKGLQVSKIDFVDAGANPDADIVLAKRQDLAEQPDSFLKGLIGYIKKHLPADQGIEPDDIEKSGAQSFTEKVSERSLEKTRDEMWSVCYAMQGSLVSILEDNDLDHAAKKEAMEQSVSEFSQAAGGFISRWSQGATADVMKQQNRLFTPKKESLEAMGEALNGMIGKAQDDSKVEHPAEPEEGGTLEMKIDKSKMTPKDQAAFEELAKAYGWTEDPDPSAASQSAAPQAQATQNSAAGGAVEKAAGQQSATDSQATAGSVGEDVEKNLHPAVRAELEALRKVRESFEDHELRDVAKKYEVIGKKADELVPVLKSLKASGEAAYDNYLAVLDEMVAMQNTSGMFSEIGKSGGHIPVGATEEDEAFAKARSKAAEIRKARPELTEEQAIDMAIAENPEIAEVLM